MSRHWAISGHSPKPHDGVRGPVLTIVWVVAIRVMAVHTVTLSVGDQAVRLTGRSALRKWLPGVPQVVKVPTEDAQLVRLLTCARRSAPPLGPVNTSGVRPRVDAGHQVLDDSHGSPADGNRPHPARDFGGPTTIPPADNLGVRELTRTQLRDLLAVVMTAN